MACCNGAICTNDTRTCIALPGKLAKAALYHLFETTYIPACYTGKHIANHYGLYICWITEMVPLLLAEHGTIHYVVVHHPPRVTSIRQCVMSVEQVCAVHGQDRYFKIPKYMNESRIFVS